MCEGGPNLLATLNPHVDELDLTIAPMLVGRQVPGPIESESQSAVGELIDWKLSGYWEHEGFVFTRYVRA